MPANEILLYGTVGDPFWEEDYFTPRQVSDWLDAQTGGAIVVRINSGGGSAVDGMAIYSRLLEYPGRVEVVIDGIAASAASLIAMAGDEIRMRPGAVLLIHDPATGSTDGRGTEADHRKTADQLATLANGYAKIYAARGKMKVDEIRAAMIADTLFDDETAIEWGLADDTDEEKAVAFARFDFSMYKTVTPEMRRASRGIRKARKPEAMPAAMNQGTGPKMPEKDKRPAATKAEATTTAFAAEATMTAPPRETPPAIDANAVTLAERQRIAQITRSAARIGLSDADRDRFIDEGTPAAEAALAMIDMRADKPGSGADEPLARPRQAATITADSREKFCEGAVLAIMARSGLKGGERNEFSGMSLSEVARAALAVANNSRKFTSRMDMVGAAFTMSAGMHGTGDFANVLANVASKAALQGWEEAVETFEAWTVPGTLTDYKTATRADIGLFPALPKKEAHAEYTYATVADRGETIALADYGALLSITRQAIIDDDLSVLARAPARMGRAARATVGNLVYAVLTGNPNMADGTALFHADHNNLAASGGAPSVTTLGGARAATRTQVEATGGQVLNISPAYLIVPAALETAANELMTSTVNPEANKSGSNPIAGMAEVIADGRLDAASTTAWFLAASPGMFDTIEVAYLDGNPAPVVEEQSAWTTDGVEMKVRQTAGVAPLDWRTMYKNAGA